MCRAVVTFTIVLLWNTVGSAAPAPVADGIYAIGDAGPRLNLVTGGDVTLGQFRTAKWDGAEMRSVANDNARFAVTLRGVDRAIDRGEPATIVFVLDHVCML